MPAKRKSKKRVARGKKLARSLPRDKKGKFLPKGSKNLFRKRRVAKKRRRKSTGRTKKPVRKKAFRRRSAPALKRRQGRATSMAARRGKGVSTSDFFPNFLTGEIVQTAVNAFTTKQQFTPIPRLKTIGNKATVMEILWIEMDFNGATLGSGTNNSTVFHFSLGAAPTTNLLLSDPRVFALISIDILEITSGGTGKGLQIVYSPQVYDLQTQDGFGYLLASDSFNVSIATVGLIGAMAMQWKLWYRFVDIPLSEFVGIVQSTQQT